MKLQDPGRAGHASQSGKKSKKLDTPWPLSEKDEVKQAERRTQKAAKDGNGSSRKDDRTMG